MMPRKPPPDRRPDWRDPDLKVWVSRVGRWVTKEEMQRAAQRGIQNPFIPPHTDDPTYNMRRKPK